MLYVYLRFSFDAYASPLLRGLSHNGIACAKMFMHCVCVFVKTMNTFGTKDFGAAAAGGAVANAAGAALVGAAAGASPTIDIPRVRPPAVIRIKISTRGKTNIF